MEKVYGYKQKDLIELAKEVSMRNNKSLTQVFKDYAQKSGKAVGTVRNIYYALVKLSERDKAFTDQYLNGTPLSACKIQPFDKQKEAWLINTVNQESKNGRSVRSVINQLAGGDVKLALRYQNKYRSAIAKAKLQTESQNLGVNIDGVKFSKATVLKLKREINGLVNQIETALRRQNARLKTRVDFLEKENLRLNNLLYGKTLPASVQYFSTPTPTTDGTNARA